MKLVSRRTDDGAEVVVREEVVEIAEGVAPPGTFAPPRGAARVRPWAGT
jgi:hypothetical protein